MTDSAIFWRGRRVLVTGATGIVGSWVVKELLHRSASVISFVLDFDSQSELIRSRSIRRTTVVQGNLECYRDLERALAVHEPQTVIHLGAQSLVGAAYHAPLATFDSNIRGTYHVLEACRQLKVSQLVIASSDKAYGDHEDLPYTESTSLRGRHPYDVSKSCADLLAQSYFCTYGLPVAIARCGNIYGGGDLNWSRIIPGTILSLLRGERPIIRSDGTYKRDYLYVRDAVHGYLSLAERVGPGVSGEGFNFSLGTGSTVLEIVTLIQKLMGCVDLSPDVRNTARAEIKHQWLSSDRALSVLGWKPSYSLERGLNETIAWYRAWYEDQQRAAEST